jgi:hypothetical protein
MKPPRVKNLGRVAGLTVWQVNGELVRRTEIEFTMGGNEAAYPRMVPHGEIWIDDVLGPVDAMATCLHEIIELDLMSEGMSYGKAHEVAGKYESEFRREAAGRSGRMGSRFDAGRVGRAYKAFQGERAAWV